MDHRSSRTVATVLCATVTTTAAVLGPAAPALADEATDPGRMVLLLDSSGSMKEAAQGGSTKIDEARKSLQALVGGLPVDTAVGLRVFGASVENAGDKGACTDSQLVVPVGTDNRAALQAAVSTYKPYGETPIGFALQEAAKDLGDKGKRSIVLVSDGIATCEPDPCEAARKLSAAGVDLTIDVVGLAVNTATRQQLQCIATAGKGRYYDAANSDQLTSALEQAGNHQPSPVTLTGKPVKGTTTPIGAPLIQAGDWRDTLGAKGSPDAKKHYVVHRTIPGSTLVASVVHNPGRTQDSVWVSFFDGDRNCTDGIAHQQRGFFASASAILTDGTCADATDLRLTVDHSLLYSRTVALPAQIRLTEVPPVTNLAAIPRPPKNATVDVPRITTTTNRAGGRSMSDAVMVPQATSVASQVAGHDVQTYKVPVGYGQRLAVTAMAAESTPAAAKAFAQSNADDGWWLAVAILDPTGQRLARDSAQYHGTSEQTVSIDIPEVNAHNRDSGSILPWLAGYYTVVVYLDGPDGRKAPAVPFALATKVTGTVSGVPVFAASGSTTSASPTPSTGAVDEESTATGAGATSPEPSQPTAAAASGGAPTSRSRALPLVLGGLGALLVAAGAVLAVARRRR